MKILLFCIFAIATICGGWWLLHRPKKPPTAVMPQGVVFNFGETEEGAVIEHSFLIVNDGTEPLELKKFITGCGCTKFAADRNIVEPKGKAMLSMTYRVRPVVGSDQVEGVVETNDPKNRVIVFRMEGTTHRPISWVPTSASFIMTNNQSTVPQVIKFTNHSNHKWRFMDVTTSSDKVEAMWNGEGYEQTCTVSVSPNCPRGKWLEYVKVVISVDDAPQTVVLPVNIIVESTN